MDARDVHPVILAGGSGTRFWPLSREKLPKQLLPILGGSSMLGLTLERAGLLAPASETRIVTTRGQAPEIRRELHALDRTGIRILEEPAARNTAAAIGLAAVELWRGDPGAILAVFPADHHIRDANRFVKAVQAAACLAAEGWLVTLGIRPEYPETGYGYIQRGEALDGPPGGTPGGPEAFAVARFTEKPGLEEARAYLREGGYSWNSGIFFWRADRFLEEMERHLPEHARVLQEIVPRLQASEGEGREATALYQSLPAISVDHGILERSDRVAVVPVDMGWSDVGSWAALRALLHKDERGNALQGDVLALDTRRCLIRAEDRLVATLGLEELVIVDTPDALLVCPEARSQEVKRVVDVLRERGRQEAVLHRQVLKPWGAYRVLDPGDRYQVKWLDVRPGERLSYQSHVHRSEHWTVVRGTATVTLDDEEIVVPCGRHVFIPAGSKHRLENRDAESLRIIEVQTGDYLGEDDIVRYEDDYGRQDAAPRRP